MSELMLLEIEFLENKEKQVNDIYERFMETGISTSKDADASRSLYISDLKGVIRDIYYTYSQNKNYHAYGVHNSRMENLLSVSNAKLKSMKELE